MTNFLISDENPKGFRLEDILTALRKDVILRCVKITDDRRPEAQHVLVNNVNILGFLNESIELAENSTQILDKAFGPSQTNSGGDPRIGD